MEQVQKFENNLFELTAKAENGEALFDVETVARSLGITQTKNGVEFVRWERVNNYLGKYSPQVGNGDFIPEAMVYKLAFKANNTLAEKFQDWLAIEVLPSIRKTGSYKGDMTQEDIMIATLESQKEIKQRLNNVTTDVEGLKQEIDLSRTQKAQLSQKVRTNAMRSVGGKKSNAYKTLYRKAISEHWKEIKYYFEVASYEEIPKLKFDEAMEIADVWQPSMELAYEIKKLNTQIEMEVY